MKHNLEGKLNDLYLKWKDPDDSYGSGIDSITELWIQNIIPEDIPFTVEDTRYQLNEKSPGRNEFVWEGLRTLNDFAYVGVDDVHREELEDLRVFATTAEDYLKTRIRWQFLQSVGASDLLALSADVARIFLALESHHRPWVSSFTQVELIKTNWLKWCVDELNIGEKLARLTEMDEVTLRQSKDKWVEALAFSQLAAGRIALIQSALEKFNKDHSSIPIHQLVNDMAVLKKAFTDYDRNCGFMTWTHVLGTAASHYREIMQSAPPASSQADPVIPDEVISLFHLLPPSENVPPKYLDLAATYHLFNWNRGQFVEGDHDQDFELLLGDAYHLYSAYGVAACAARSSQSARPTDDGSWATRLLVDAEELRHTYAAAVDTRYRSYAQSMREYRHGITDMLHDEMKLMGELVELYSRWKVSKVLDDGNEITSITALLIRQIVPEGIPVTETTLWEPVEGNSQSHNEFVREVLRALLPFTYLWAYCEVEDVHRHILEDLRVWIFKRQHQLETQIRLAMGGSHGFFADSPEDGFDIFDLHDRIAQVNEALKSDTVPVISSLTQKEFLYPDYLSWCIGINIKKSLDKVYKTSRKDLLWPEEAYGLALSQLVVGRLQLMDRSVSAFLEQCKHLPRTKWSEREINDLKLAVNSIRHHTEKHQKRVSRSMEMLSERWREVLEEEGVEPIRQTIEFAFKQFKSGNEVPYIDLSIDVTGLLEQLPIPENVPPEFLVLAARYNQVRYRMFKYLRSKRLHKIFKEAAACSSGGGGHPAILV
ncbi:hypothetical protein SeLEV6574_g02249 [Synchytrium endobioticum]|uniref:Uncharacterized protein n=1 Tax=Synchytrium endobioticum TaxID=286115 RepID=A0A507D904_9FUNG|nr:hypothetical protein SeLEV6574_g02249 [Synchytrium endobioticum]